MAFDLPTYLDRIGLAACPPTAAGLAALQRAQLSSIPFENIDPFTGTVPDLALDAIWTKLVLSGRGGYCFELNALLGEALQAVGFDARPVLVRVRMGAPVGSARAHLAWIVRLDGHDRYVDVGFGGPGALEPLTLVADTEQDAPNARYRFRPDHATAELVLERWSGGEWFALHGVNEDPFTPADVHAANFLCARWPEFSFVGNLLMSRHGPDGQTTLMNRAARLVAPDGVRAWTIESRDELGALISGPFGIDCDAATVDALWGRLQGVGTAV
tara:strand:+ start:274 stop:1089 length:816 start_codon:yes stop_codon:yes gene_type:complete